MRGYQLRQIRHRLGLTQAEFGEKLGVAPNSVARWERDEIPISQLVENYTKLLDRLEGAKRATKKK